ncbi:MAG: sugar phosphate isomerase/epimerase family protein [bacterium]
MKKGINIWSFSGGMSIKECMKIAKNAGFEGIELALTEEGEINLASSEKDILRFKEMAEDIGIEISGFAAGLYWKYPFTSNDKEIREKAKSICKKQLEIASILGVDTILVVPGAVGVDFMPQAEIVEYDVAYDRALEALSQLVTEAERMKVCIGVENVWNKFLLSPLEMRDFIDRLDSNYVGAYVDVGNIIYIGYPEHWIRILGKRIKKVHVKDFRRQGCGLAGFVDLLAGDVNYPKVIETLKEVGYDGYLNAEMSPYRDYPIQIIYNTSKSMDRILGRE